MRGNLRQFDNRHSDTDRKNKDRSRKCRSCSEDITVHTHMEKCVPDICDDLDPVLSKEYCLMDNGISF